MEFRQLSRGDEQELTAAIETLMAQGGIYRRFVASRGLAVGWQVQGGRLHLSCNPCPSELY